MENSANKRIVCVGGGHANCQVLKSLKETIPADAELILVSNGPKSYYSGMLPGSVASKSIITQPF
jgi:NADH dehydrogenase FAD-containing subunit